MQLSRLGVNIDHIATLRQLRGTPYPGILEAARLVEKAGGNQITVHLREDRRHIQDEDVKGLRAELRVPLNLEMAATDSMVRFAVKVRPDWVCLVPEKREELTTEGGLDIAKNKRRIGDAIARLKRAGIRVSCFVEPEPKAVGLASELGADAIELHTGKFCGLTQKKGLSPLRVKHELLRIQKAAFTARGMGLAPHAGHGFDYDNVRQVAGLHTEKKEPLVIEYNIGHAIICRAAIVGLERSVREMLAAIQAP